MKFTIDPSIATGIGLFVSVLMYIQNGTIPAPPALVTPDTWHLVQAWCAWILAWTIPLTALVPSLSSAKVGPLVKANPSESAKIILLFVVATAAFTLVPHPAFAMTADTADRLRSSGFALSALGVVSVFLALFTAFAYSRQPIARESETAQWAFVAGLMAILGGGGMFLTGWLGG